MTKVLAVFAILALVVVMGGRLVNERVFGWIASASLGVVFGVLAANEDSVWRWAMLAAAVAEVVDAVQRWRRQRRGRDTHATSASVSSDAEEHS